MAGIDMLHVPYRGGAPALADLIGGQVQMMFISAGASIEYIRSGRLRALAITSATRSEALPDIPPVGDFVPGYEMTTWFGLGAPKDTPAEIVASLNTEITAGLADARLLTRLADIDAAPFALSPGAFATFIADETEKWGKVVRAANIKAG
jgi:tripartite-type tricarboxylate transporter receptor subunit TctC